MIHLTHCHYLRGRLLFALIIRHCWRESNLHDVCTWIGTLLKESPKSGHRRGWCNTQTENEPLHDVCTWIATLLKESPKSGHRTGWWNTQTENEPLYDVVPSLDIEGMVDWGTDSLDSLLELFVVSTCLCDTKRKRISMFELRCMIDP